jgi:hypothetical protein
VLFFLIIPAWLLFLFTGIGLICFQAYRHTGIYVIVVSTCGTVLSLCLSTAVFYVGSEIGLQHLGRWSGVALIAIYVLAVLAGGLAGCIAGFWLTRNLLARR